METTSDIRITSVKKLIAPRILKERLPLTPESASTVRRTRAQIQAVLKGEDHRLLGIVGPCSIHDKVAALDYASRFRQLAEKVSSTMLLLMRVYFEKPRTSIGWRGLILDPKLDGSYAIEEGLETARGLLLQITSLGLGTATEVLDPIVPQYIADLVSWAAIGARTTESQTHREMASGLSMPVGFKNATDGNLDTAIQAIKSAAHPRSFIGIDQDGETAVLTTTGNPCGHIILRGGRSGPNYSALVIQKSADTLAEHSLPPFVMVDCSHGNSEKNIRNQSLVFQDILCSRLKGKPVGGFMLESHLQEGNQAVAPFSELSYGISITDACIGWQETEALLLEAHSMLKG